jgi:thiol-disulfide isomerase/thioredoxin
MQFRKFVPFLLILAILLAACSQSRPTSESMPKEKPTQAEIAEGNMPEATAGSMMDTPTADAMMEDQSQAMKDTATPDVMMEDQSQGMMGTATPDTMMDDKSGGMMDTATPETMMDSSKDMMETPTPEMGEGSMMTPAWFATPLTDVSTQESFTINDLKGKVVLVEMMAQWCHNCLQQQKQVLELHQLLGDNPDFVSLGLDIDANEDGASLLAYTEENGFAWRYAVSPAETSREIGNLYGSQFLNPISTPMLIIDRQGEVHLLPFGIKSADELFKALEPFLMAAE